MPEGLYDTNHWHRDDAALKGVLRFDTRLDKVGFSQGMLVRKYPKSKVLI
jgi:hypothetical protein